jgi:hypothetical protein
MADSPDHTGGLRAVTVLANIVAASAAMLLGTLGWFIAGFGIDSNCTDHFSCGGSCPPCSATVRWLDAVGVGEWVIFIAAVVLLVLGLVRPRWLRITAYTGVGLVPASILWYFTTVTIAEHSY